MRFKYIAAQTEGKVVEGTLEADSHAAALAALAAKGLRPISLKELGGLQLSAKHGGRVFGQKITITDKVFLTKYLSLMLKVGTDLFKAIDILIADFRKPVLKALLFEIRSSLEKGRPFYLTFSRYPKFFSPIFVNMVKAGESSGNLEQVFGDLSASLEREKELKGKVRAALIYPALLLALSFIILVFLVSFALPKIAGVFEGSFEPPFFSRMVFAAGLFLNRYIFVFIGLVLAGVAGAIVFLRSSRGKLFFSRFVVRVPFVGDLLKRVAIQRFAAVLSSLLKAGLPLTDALEITADAVGHAEIRESLRRISREGITQGITLGDAFRREVAFPSVVTNLVAVSEKAGHLDEILVTLAEFYEAEIDTALKSFVSFVEPAMLLLIGGVVGLIALAIIVPIYQLVGQF